jgi:peptide/nickel transport system substrate-binding protein
MMRSKFWLSTVLLFFVFCNAKAADLAIGLGFDLTSMDPHFANITSNNVVLRHVFDRLVVYDNQRVLQPGVAISWRTLDDLTWEFKLRPGVRFHDGSELTAEDVIWSIDRPALLTNSPSPFTVYTKSIVEKTQVDKYTVRLKTAVPNALMLDDLSTIVIVSKKATTGLTTDDFNNGRGMIGSGPYKFVQFKRGDRVELARNETYWGSAPDWNKVTFRIITTPAARVAALLSGDVQMIEGVPPADIAKLKQNSALNVVTALSSRLIYFSLDVDQESSPFVTDKAGKPMAKNPLKDRRVRLAISKAVNRAAIVDKVMEGNAAATGQFIPLGFWGSSPNLKVEPLDIDGAKKLMAEAGYPDGFGLTLHSTNDRYVNDAKIIQTIAQMLNRIGIVSKVESMPASVFFARRIKLEFSAALAGWGGGAANPSSYLRALVTTFDAKTGAGAVNNGRYSNPKVDALVTQALTTIDQPRQEKLWQQAAEIALADQAIVPLHNQFNVWALRKGYRFVPRGDEATYAYEVHPEK